MELSFESVRHAEDSTRPISSKFVELHVLFVPGDQWNVRLNKVPTEATESFISAGFIRVHPDTTLKTLRTELGDLLGGERNVKRFSFLRCVGRSLALVKSKQEKELKVKTFAPPYTAQPELYLLPAVETDGSLCSQSFTTDTSSSPEQQICCHPPKMSTVPTGTKKPVKFPHIPQCSQQAPPPSGLEEEGRDEEDEGDDQSCCSSEAESEEEALCSIRRAGEDKNAEKTQYQRALQLVSLQKALDRCEAASAQVKWFHQGGETCKKTKPLSRNGLSGAAESLEDRDSGFSLTDSAVRKSKDAHTLKFHRNQPTVEVSEGPAVSSQPARCTTPLPGLDLDTVTNKAATVSPVFLTNRETIIEELKLVKEERKQLEWTRQQLLSKGKDLLAQNRHRRNQARDSWKKKYFETKKATAPLEEQLRNLKQELETFYNKVLRQLQARDNRGKPRRQGRPSEKNELIIQIMKESYEIDNLKRQVEDADMKLMTEIKLRNQAATELRALKAELAQKKNQSSHPGLMGNTTRDKLQISPSM